MAVSPAIRPPYGHQRWSASTAKDVAHMLAALRPPALQTEPPQGAAEKAGLPGSGENERRCRPKVRPPEPLSLVLPGARHTDVSHHSIIWGSEHKEEADICSMMSPKPEG